MRRLFKGGIYESRGEMRICGKRILQCTVIIIALKNIIMHDPRTLTIQ